MRPDAPAGRRGFTLLEALVATAVAALILVPVLNSMASGARVARAADSELRARLVLDRLLAALPVGHGALIPSAAGRDGDFAWTLTVSRAPDAPRTGAAFVPYQVAISVSGAGATVSAETYRLGPP